jgi:hypothetical protein
VRRGSRERAVWALPALLALTDINAAVLWLPAFPVHFPRTIGDVL